MILKKCAAAGTLESSDCRVMVMPGQENVTAITLTSTVEAQFGDAIKKTVSAVLEEMDVRNAVVSISDHGALDCTIRARTLCALCRSAEVSYDWSREDEQHV